MKGSFFLRGLCNYCCWGSYHRGGKLAFFRREDPDGRCGGVMQQLVWKPSWNGWGWECVLHAISCKHPPLCHRSSFNPWCDVSGIFFLKTFYVSLIYKSRIVFKIFTEPFLSCTLPQRGEISNISNRQTKSAWKYIITLSILLSQPYTPQETNIYKAGMLLWTRRVCIL